MIKPLWKISFLIVVAVAIALRLVAPVFSATPTPAVTPPQVIAQWQRVDVGTQQDTQVTATYQKGYQSLSLTATYMPNSRGDVIALWQRVKPVGIKIIATAQVEYGYFADQGQNHITACLSPDQSITATAERFAQNRRAALTPARWLSWAIGTQELRDWRCLWLTMTTPDSQILAASEIIKLWQSLPPFEQWLTLPK
ncbi:MAG: hypothetical protein HC919_15220 [Oscillatoriales cyanobacterium SM2_2_1]|nr:hypothetical protein [Oscillatoriales cyanobacterium SM2_2_1]